MKYTIESADDRLIEACLAGDKDAWAALVSKYESLIYATCRRYNLQPMEADDIFGRVCLIWLQNLHTLKDHSRLSSWLITTTNRVCWRYRKQPHHLSLNATIEEGNSSTVVFDEPADEGILPDEAVLELERQQFIQNAVAKLAPRCQKLIQLLFFDPTEPSYQQIASIMDMPVASIGPVRARCLAKLKIHLHSILKD